MTSEPDSLQTPHEADSMLSLTPVMSETEVARATELSMAHVRPPLRVPGYEKEQFLGRGAFGEVWRAVDSNSGRVVAIKFYSRRGGLDWSHMSREVEKLQFLFSDRHVVQLFDVGWKATPPYYVMEYMENGSLEDRLKAGPMSVTEAVSMIRNIALGLSRAHDLGILHCDLKPDNIMLDNEGKPRLADFGQSRLKHEHAPAVGTLFYMAPEQAELSMVPDARWDVYALGAILYRMVTGRLPYLTKESADNVSSQGSVDKRLRAYSQLLLTSQPPTDHHHVPGVDAALSRIIDRCLAVNPKRRYPNVQSVLHALALRESRLSQRPLMMVGILGPAIVMIVLTLVSILLFNQTLRTARSLLLDRTYESNQFAARSVASRFAMDIDRRWQILEQEATHEPLIEWLQDAREPPDAAAPPAAIALWLDRRFEHWNAQFNQQTTASYWYVVDRNGILRAITPSGHEVIGQYFGYREYFHGQGRQLSRSETVPPTITAAHRSNAFRSQPTNRPAVSLSVPIHGQDGQPIVGVLVMEAELGHFAEFQGARNQAAVLVDLRPDESQRRGLILEHPHFGEQLRAKMRVDEVYIPENTLAVLDSIQRRQHAAAKGDSQNGASRGTELTVLEAYADPVTDGSKNGLIAVVEPVFIRREGNRLLDSGWVLLVQEQRAEILEPINRLLSIVTYGSAAALLLVVLIMAGLWWLVAIVQNAPNRLRASQLWGGHFTSSSERKFEFADPRQAGGLCTKAHDRIGRHAREQGRRSARKQTVARSTGGSVIMMEMLARGEQDNQQWTHALPTDAAVIVGRDAGSWSVPWERWISRQHVELRLEDDHVRVRRLSEARNPILFRGEQPSSFSMHAGECFVIGKTMFTLTSGTDSGDSGRADDEPLLRSFSISQEELQHVPFRDAPHRLDVLGHLSKIIFSITDESELFVQTANLLLEGIRKANAIAIVKVDRNASSDLQILHAEYRVSTGGAFQPSRRLSREAILRLNRSLVHIWNTQQKKNQTEPEMFTLRGDFDWAFCTPLRGEACDGLGIYVAGRLTEGSPDTILIAGQSNDLSEDVKFAELVATIVSALREMQALQHRQSVLSHFFSPSVLRILSTADPETALAPRETEVTVLFCDLRGFSRKVESSSESLSSILDRVSEALGVMSTCILNHKGAIADFLGDCAIGFWGWPLSQKDDVQQACTAAADIQSAFEKYAKQKDHPLFGFEVGVGIGTGRAVAGKIGSRDQAKVTVFGPVVNLASRLEGLTRLLRVPILLDEPTAKVVTEMLPGTRARCRPLARIKPYGLDSSLIVSELLQPSTETSLLTDQHLAHYRSALAAFLEGRWGDAYIQLHNVPPEDRGKDLLLSFILNHNHTPPPGWDGVILMQSKS